MNEFIKKIMESLDKAPFTEDNWTGVCLTSMEGYEKLSAEEKQKLNDRLKWKTIYRDGYKVVFNPEKLCFESTFVKKVEAIVYEKRNRPYIRFRFVDPNIKRIHSRSSAIKKINAELVGDHVEFTAAIRDFVDAFDEEIFYTDPSDGKDYHLNEERIWFEKGSITEYYMVGNSCYVKPTAAMANKFWNDIDMDLLLKSINIDHHSNGWGIRLFVFTNHLVQWCGDNFVLDEEFFTSEIFSLLENKASGYYASKLKDAFLSLSATPEEKKKTVEAAKSLVAKYQSVIDDNAAEILVDAFPVFNSFSDDSEKLSYLRHLEANMGFDCGFIYFTTESDTVRKASLYYEDRENPIMLDGYFSLRLPVSLQSTTIKKKIAASCTSFFKAAGLPDAVYKVVLD